MSTTRAVVPSNRRQTLEVIRQTLVDDPQHAPDYIQRVAGLHDQVSTEVARQHTRDLLTVQALLELKK